MERIRLSRQVPAAFVPRVSLTRAMSDPELFGTVFESPSFWTWKTLARLIDGLPLTEPREIELFEQCTGRQYNRHSSRAYRRIIILAGRRAGKDRFESAVAVWRCALCADWHQYQSAGEQQVAILLGADRKQASILRRYCEGLLRQPLLAAEVVRQTKDLIAFRNGSSLEIATNSAALVRGRSAIAVLGSEACQWQTSEYSSSNDEEVVSAALPSMAMCPDGGLLLLGSSVHRPTGYMFRRFRELFGNADADDLCWFATSQTMNSKLPTAIIEKALADDPAKARAEFLNEWRQDLSSFCPFDVIEGVTEPGVYERPPRPGVRYVAMTDCAGGTGSDSFTLAIAHRGAPIELDLIRERKPRFIPAQVIAELAVVLKAYGIKEVQSDRYAIGFHQAEWAAHGIKLIECERTTSDNYLAALPLLLAKRVRLLDNATLRNQLASLERRVGAGERETVSHPPSASAHDDVATSACGALVLAAQRQGSDYLRIMMGGDQPVREQANERARAYRDELLRRFGQPVALLREEAQ